MLAGAGDIPGIVTEPPPSISFDPGFSDSGIGLTVNLQVQEFANQVPVKNALRRRIFMKFKEMGIVPSYPSLTLYLRGGGSGKRIAGPAQPNPQASHQ